MVGLGYRVVEGPEIEHDYYNFTALNHPPGPPGADAPGHLLRAVAPRGAAAHPHLADAGRARWRRSRRRSSSSSPARSTGATPTPPTARCSTRSRGWRSPRGSPSPTSRGRCWRCCRAIFGAEREVRLRPHFFPFTEPSVEVDVSCFQCDGTGALAGGERCNLCKGQGWIEILGAGMVDPNVLGFVESNGYDPERVQGFAFGLGVERVAMLRHGVPDLRRFFDNDVRMLEQFCMRVPYSWLREYCDPGVGAGGARRAAGDDRDRGRAGRRRRPALGRGLRRRQGARAPSSTPTPTGCGSARSTPATASAHDRLRRPQRRRRPDRRRRAARRADAGRREAAQGEAARGRLRRDDPLRRRARDRRGRRRDPRPRRRARRRARRWPRCCRWPSRCSSSR